MNIEVSGVNKTSQGVEVWFRDRVYNGEKLSKIGTRACRILRKLAPHTYIGRLESDTSGCCFFVRTSSAISALKTQTSVQKQMDKYVNTKFTLDFQEVRVTDGGPIGSMRTVIRRREQGVVISVSVDFKSNLPLLQEDIYRLTKALSQYKAWVAFLGHSDDELTASVELSGKRSSEDPWKFGEELKSKVLKVPLL